MEKIKQKVYAFKTAEKLYNKRKTALKSEFTSEMHKAIRTNNMDYYEALKIDYRIYFPDIADITIISIESLYNTKLNNHGKD